MIVIQNFPTVAALQGWLHNARMRQGRRDFAEWLSRYLRERDFVVNDRQYRFRDCINLLNGEDGYNVG